MPKAFLIITVLPLLALGSDNVLKDWFDQVSNYKVDCVADDHQGLNAVGTDHETVKVVECDDGKGARYDYKIQVN